MANFIISFFKAFAGVLLNVYKTFRYSRLARALLIIVIIKFSIFYGFFKAYLYPRHLKPKWESEQHRIESVTEDLIKNSNTNNYD